MVYSKSVLSCMLVSTIERPITFQVIEVYWVPVYQG